MSLTRMSLSAVLILTLLLIIQNAQTGRTTDTCSTATCRYDRLSQPNHQKGEVFEYLKRYGYLDETWKDVNSVPAALFTEGIRRFQEFSGLPESGTIDNTTIERMKMRRCGFPDILGVRPVYRLTGMRWPKNNLTYRIFNYPQYFTFKGLKLFPNKKNSVDNIFRGAFREWSRAANIRFQCRRRGIVDIEIYFLTGKVWNTTFDGRHGIIASTYSPPFGRIFFDNDEDWAEGAGDRYEPSLYMVALHEIGHAIGLSHSTDTESVMHEDYMLGKEHLARDDVLGAQAIYGSN